MFRKLFAICAIACLAGTFVACGGPGKAAKDEKMNQRKPAVSKDLPSGEESEGDDSVKKALE